VSVAIVSGALAAGVLVHAGQQGSGQSPAPWPLSQSIRERGSSVTGAYDGWYFNKDGSVSMLVGYFNRNTKQEFDIPIGPNNHIDPGGPDQGQPTHFAAGRTYGIFTIKVPKDFGQKKLTWTIVANGQTNVITLHTKPEYIIEPYLDAASKNTPPVVRFQETGGAEFTGPPIGIAQTYTATVGVPLIITTWMTDEGPKVNVPEPGARGRGRGRGAAGATGATGAADGRAAAAAAAGAAIFSPQPMSISWSLFRGPAVVKFDNARPSIDRDHGGKATINATFSEPGEYTLRAQANDTTGDGGGGFQCCWSNAHVKVTVKAATTSGQ
jgi:hypothetical protein